jgi:hypothetical protein
LKRVIEAIGEVGQADDKGQLHDLLLVIIPSQFFKHILPNSGGGPCYKLNKMESGFVLLIESVASLVEG